MTFDDKMTDHQILWRRANIENQEAGHQCGKARSWILPRDLWEESLWDGIGRGSENSLPDYLQKEGVQEHQGVHNLKSSWIQCVNTYFPFRKCHGLQLLAGFLKEYVSSSIESVEAVELEYEEAPPFDPPTLLGEPGGDKRGVNQTSPDIAFIVRTLGGKGLILTENKLVEHSFYPCSGRASGVKNPDKTRCLDWEKLLADLPKRCWQLRWKEGERRNRKYWDYIQLSEYGRKTLTRCPAATAGYQLFRQQALAEGIAASGRYDLVVSCVAYDERNTELIHCLRTSGVDNFATRWGALFDGQAQFATFTHQQWVAWVRAHDSKGHWRGWLDYMESRYGYV
jgi:hypothetical protein